MAKIERHRHFASGAYRHKDIAQGRLTLSRSIAGGDKTTTKITLSLRQVDADHTAEHWDLALDRDEAAYVLSRLQNYLEED